MLIFNCIELNGSNCVLNMNIKINIDAMNDIIDYIEKKKHTI